jgi:hypothetical protein
VAKAGAFRLAYLLGIRKGQLRATLERHVLITGDTWKLTWPAKTTKGGKKTKRAHVVVLVGEACEIVERRVVEQAP